MSKDYLEKLSPEAFKLEVDGILRQVNRCHRVTSKSDIRWHFVEDGDYCECILEKLTSPQLIAFYSLFSEVCSFMCFISNHNLSIRNW